MCKQPRPCCGVPLHALHALHEHRHHVTHNHDVKLDKLQQQWTPIGTVLRGCCNSIHATYTDENGQTNTLLLGNTEQQAAQRIEHLKSFI